MVKSFIDQELGFKEVKCLALISGWLSCSQDSSHHGTWVGILPIISKKWFVSWQELYSQVTIII